MPHIFLNHELPGIRSLAAFRPETGKPLYDLAQVLLHHDSPLSKAERELIAGYVSRVNQCEFCCNSHSAASRAHYGESEGIVDEVLQNGASSALSPKVNSLLKIARKVAIGGREVQQADIDAARAAGAEDRDIHDTVLIAAAFSMYNRYVDGLATTLPENPDSYIEMGKRMAFVGYVPPKH